MIGDVEGEPPRVHGSTHAQAERPQKDVEAGAVAEIAEVWGSEFQCLGTCFVKIFLAYLRLHTFCGMA
jgi:hypothetical protein